MITISYSVSEGEHILIKAIREVGYGSIFGISLSSSDDPKTTVVITEPTQRLIDFMRDGHPEIEELQVHQSEPAYAIVKGVTLNGGWSCKKKTKFL